MSLRFFPPGLASLANGTIDFDTDTMNIALLDLDGSPTDTAIKAITAASNATPIVVTSTSHGFANGDIVVIRGVGGNTAANGTWRVANQAANTFELTTATRSTALNSTGNGAYTSGGCVINLTLGDLFSEIDGAVVGTPVALGSKTVAAATGALDAADPTFSAFSGDVHAWVIYEASGSNLFFNDGRCQVIIAADASSSATTLAVEPIEGTIASGAVIVFSNGISATLTSQASAGARTLAVSAISGAIAAGHTGDAATLNNGLPLTAAGNGVTITFDAAGIGTP
jgi:hypothetical protein